MTARNVAAPPPPGSGAMFDGIARRYDSLNLLASFGRDRAWRRRLVASLALGPGAHVLDVATGTGDVAVAIARGNDTARVVGLDPSVNMLAVAREKVARAGLAARIELVVGDAQALPFADHCYDAVTIAFGIRNVPNRAVALQEMTRVTRRGGRVAVLELGMPPGRGLATLARVHVEKVVPWIGARLSGATEYDYLRRSIAAFPPATEFAAMLGAAGLADVTTTPMTFGAATLFVGTRTG